MILSIGRERTRFAAPFFISTNKTREARASLSASNDYRVEHQIAYDKGRYYLRESQVMMQERLQARVQERLQACRYVETVTSCHQLKPLRFVTVCRPNYNRTTTELQPMGADCPHVGGLSNGYQMVV